MNRNKRIAKKVLAAVMTATMVMPSVPAVTAFAEDTAEVKFPDVYTYDLVQPCDDDELIEAKVTALVAAMTTEEKWSFLTGNGSLGSDGNAAELPGVPRLGVPLLRMYDGPTGLYYQTDTTNPPQEEMLAATWDEELAYAYGEMDSYEAIAIGAGMMLSAQLDIQRTPQFSRTKDQLGADPYLVANMGDDLVAGMQSQGGIAVLKHFVAYTEGSNSDYLSEQALHELYLAPFEAAVKNAEALGIMSSYNLINGTYASANDYLQNDVLRDMWGYNYFTITDWGGNHEYTMDKGTDIEMYKPTFNGWDACEELIASGEYTEEEILAYADEAVTRILRAYGKAGYLTLVDFDEDGNLLEEVGRTEPIDQIDRETATARLEELAESSNATAQAVAEGGGVLLKNENSVLPLTEDDSVAVIGMGGSFPFGGFGGERSYGSVKWMTSPADALADILGEEKVTAEVYSDIVGTTVPNEVLYTSADGDEHGVVRTYGCAGTIGENEGQQGQIFARGLISETAMEGHEIGEVAAIEDTIDYTTGTIDGEPNATYVNEGADEGTATAFEVEEDPAYTIETYIEAPEDGEYTICYQSIGDTSKCFIYDTDGETELATACGVNNRQNCSWYGSLVPTSTGMNIENMTVTLKAGERYKVSIQIIAGTTYKDVQCNLSWITPSQKQANLDNAIAAAETNNKVVVFAYRNNNNITNESIDTLGLDLGDDQIEMINSVAEAAHAAGNEVIVVLNSDGPAVMEDWIDNVDGILYMYYPGQRGGVATANLLTGVVNPSGKLAYTIPKTSTDTLITCSDEAFATYQQEDENGVKVTEYYEGINTDYKWFDENDIEPEFDFGFGLSYTTFEYSDLSVELAPAEGESVGYDVTFTVTNTGDVAGSEVTELYLGEAEVPEGIQTSKYALAGFEKVKDLEPGESREVTLHVSERSLSYWNSNLTEDEIVNEDGSKWTVATGTRTIYVGASSDNLILQADVDVE